jgi:hypothetical protein
MRSFSVVTFRLRQTHFLQWRAHLEFPRRLRTGSMIADVAGVFAVGNDGKFFRASNGFQFGEQLALAEVTTVVRVREIGLIRELRGLHHSHRNMESGRQFERFLQLPPGQTGRVRNHSQRPLAQFIPRDAGEEHRVHSARVCHQARTEGAEQRTQLFELFHEAKRATGPG